MEAASGVVDQGEVMQKHPLLVVGVGEAVGDATSSAAAAATGISEKQIHK